MLYEGVALEVLPETFDRTNTFECFKLKFSPLSTQSFWKKTSSPLQKRGELEPTRVYLYPSSLCNIV
jgi:hypothetical protein